MLVEHAFRRAGPLVEVIEVPVGDQLVQVFQTDKVLHKNDLVVGRQLFRVAARERGVDVAHALRAEIVAQALDEVQKDLAEHRRIVRGAVVVERLQLQVFRDRVELAVADIPEHRAAHRDRVDVNVRERHLVPAARGAQERGVKIRVVRNEDRVFAAELEERPHGLLLLRRAPHHLVGDAGQLGDLLRDRLFGVHNRVEALGDLAAVDAHRADLGDALRLRREAGRLEVETDEIRVEPRVGLAGHGGHEVVDEIALHTVDHLEVAAALFDLEPRVHRVRKRLRDAVVGDRNGLLAPLVRLIDEISGGGHAVHRGHIRVQVQLHALFLRRIDHLDHLGAGHRVRPHDVLAVVFVILHRAGHEQRHALFDAVGARALAHGLDQLERDRIRVVGDVDRVDLARAVARLLNL